MVTQYIERILSLKSSAHRETLRRLGSDCKNEPLSPTVKILPNTPQVRGINTIIQDADTSVEDFIFYFDRMATLLIETALNSSRFMPKTVETPANATYNGLAPSGVTSAVVILRAGAAFETGLKRVIPDCLTGRMLIQSSAKTGEPELHYQKLPKDISRHQTVLLLDPQMSSGGAALMAVQVLIDHGVKEENIVFVTYFAGREGLRRLCAVWRGVRVVVGRVVRDYEGRWIERRYFRC